MFIICSRHRPSRRSPGRRPEGPGHGPVKPESAGFGPVTGKTRGFLADTIYATWDWLQKRSSQTTDNIGACAIMDRYIAPVLVDKPDSLKILIRQDMMSRFDRLTGAKVGEYEYNSELLHRWMQTNAARFLVENRAKLS